MRCDNRHAVSRIALLLVGILLGLGCTATGSGALDDDTDGAAYLDAEDPTVSTGSMFGSFHDGIDYLEQGRSDFYAHARWKGWPAGIGDEGSYHEDYTFPATFTWDDDLAEQAQIEAQRLGDGSEPKGIEVPGYSNAAAMSGHEWQPIHVDGLNTESWMISSLEIEEEIYGWGLCWANTRAKKMWHYHDFGGDGPAIERWGVGAFDNGDGSTWWVLKMAP